MPVVASKVSSDIFEQSKGGGCVATAMRRVFLRKEVLLCLVVVFLSVLARSQVPKEKPLLPIQLVGNMSFVRAPAFHLELKDDADVNAMLTTVEAFERAHMHLRITSRQFLVTDAGLILGVMLGHEPRTNEHVLTAK